MKSQKDYQQEMKNQEKIRERWRVRQEGVRIGQEIKCRPGCTEGVKVWGMIGAAWIRIIVEDYDGEPKWWLNESYGMFVHLPPEHLNRMIHRIRIVGVSLTSAKAVVVE